MDYAAWKLFVEAAELGSLSKVALARGTTQPNISRQIADLEAACGGRLFTRNGRGVVLTDLGHRIAPKVRAWMASTDQLTNEVRASAGTPIGKVRLGSLPSTAHPLVSTLYTRLKARYPLVELSVREGQGAQLETWLEDGSVDLAILYRTAPRPSDGDVYLVETDTFLVGRRDDPLLCDGTVPFKALDGLPLVLFCRPSSWRNHLEQLAAARGIALNVALEADSLSLQTHIAAEGGVYALLGPHAIAAAESDCPIRAAKIVAPVLTRPIALAQSRHGELTLACRTVMAMAKEIVKAGGAGLRRGA